MNTAHRWWSRLLTVAACLLAAGTLEAQSSAKFGIGLHAGADLSDDDIHAIGGVHLMAPVGGMFGLFADGTYRDANQGSVIWGAVGAQLRWVRDGLQPYVAGGVVMQRASFAETSATQWGWTARGGIAFAGGENVKPFIELRLLNAEGTLTQVLAGFTVPIR